MIYSIKHTEDIVFKIILHLSISTNTSVGIKVQNCILGLGLWLRTLIGQRMDKQQ